MQALSFAALYHGLSWRCPFPTIDVSPRIEIGHFSSHPLERLYLDLCETTKIDDGDGFAFDVFAVFKTIGPEEIFYDFGSPYTLIDQFSNIIAIITGQPIGLCRVLCSRDNFKSISETEIIYSANEGTYFDLIKDWKDLEESKVSDLVKIWNNIKPYYDKSHFGGRVTNALSYYYSAWRSHSLEQTCINLAVVLELLFSPYSQSEINHQIAFNVAKYIGNTIDERKRIYKTLKTFYGVRSAIIHGGMPTYEKISPKILPGYVITTEIMRKILSDSKYIHIFSDETKRREMLEDLLFE